jgi:hypothetical protein
LPWQQSSPPNRQSSWKTQSMGFPSRQVPKWHSIIASLHIQFRLHHCSYALPSTLSNKTRVDTIYRFILCHFTCSMIPAVPNRQDPENHNPNSHCYKYLKFNVQLSVVVNTSTHILCILRRFKKYTLVFSPASMRTSYFIVGTFTSMA